MESESEKRKNLKQILSENWFNDIKNDDKNAIKGLNILHEKYPIDEKVMKVCNEYKLNVKDLFKYLNNNIFNNLTSFYKQVEKNLNKKGIKTLGDLTSDKFIGYLNNTQNYIDNKNNNQQKYQKDLSKINDESQKTIKNCQDNQINILEELKKIKSKYDKGEFKKNKKDDKMKISSRRKSQLYGQQLLLNSNLLNATKKKK
jgi:hypothetical protein